MNPKTTRIRQRAVALAALSILAIAGVYSLALIPLFVPSLSPIVFSTPVLYSALGAFLAVTLARTVLMHRLAPDEQAFLGFWVHTPYFTLLIAVTLGSLPALLVVIAGPSLGWSPDTVVVVLRGIAAWVLVSSVLLVRVLWHRHRASLRERPGGSK